MFLSTVVHRARLAGVSVSLCGEMASDPVEAMALIGIGFRQISMTPAAIGPVKAMIRSLDTGKVMALVEDLKKRGDHSVRGDFLKFARTNAVVLS